MKSSRIEKSSEKRLLQLLERGWKMTIWVDEDGMEHEVVTYDAPYSGYRKEELGELTQADFDALMNYITAQDFTKMVGRDPEDDDLERCNCCKGGEPGHYSCGICRGCNLPRFMCPCPLNIPPYKFDL